MADTYFVQTNRQYEESIDIDRLFDEIGVVATFADHERWGEQLAVLDAGDTVISYDQPTQQFVGIGTVEEPWDESSITDPNRKVAPDRDVQEFQVQVQWENWFPPGEGYDKEDINRVLGYSDRNAPSSAVQSVSSPSTEQIQTVYTAMANGEDMPTPDQVAENSDSNTLMTETNYLAGERSQAETEDPQLFVQRGSDGPYRQNLGTSLTTPLSEDLRAELQYLIDKSGVESPEIAELYELLDDENVTAWGSRSEHDVVESMSAGDQVLYVDRKGTRDIRYQQEIDLALASPEDGSKREALQGRMAELIWRDENFTSLWFSTKNLVNYQNPSDDEGYKAFNEVIQNVDDSFTYYGSWFTKSVTGPSLVNVSETYCEHYGGTAGFIAALEDTDYVERSDEPSPGYLIVNADKIRERDFHPVVHEFDGYDADPANQEPDERVKYIGRFSKETPDQAGVLTDADVRGYVLVRDDDEIVASAKLGCVFGKTVDEDFAPGHSGRQYKIGALVDYREFSHAVSLDNPQIEVSSSRGLDPRAATVAPVAADSTVGQRTYETAQALAVSPDYQPKLQRFLEAEQAQADIYATAAVHLVSGKNIIFYGPPGTGKTRAATRLSRDALGIDYDLSTAHAELTNYDIVGGYAPGTAADNATQADGDALDVEWQANPGIVTQAVEQCESALETTDRHHWLVFDELNRANIDQAFGDIFTLLDLDYRTKQTLSYADESTPVPLSFRLLGTMNTEDQAKLFALGDAFRRRFGFVPVRSLVDTTTAATDQTEREPDVDVPQLPNEDRIRNDVVDGTVQNDLTRARILVDEPAPVIHTRDAATIDPVFGTSTRVAEAYEAVMDGENYGYTGDVDGLDVAMGLAAFLDDEKMLTLGHAHFIDIAKFLTVAELVDPDGVSREWLDEAVIAYLLPQLNPFFTRLREEQAVGHPGRDEEGTLASKLGRFLDLLDAYGLTRSRAVIEEREHGIGTV